METAALLPPTFMLLRPNGLAPMLSSNKDDWNTPGEVLEAVARLGPIDLDPCSNLSSIVDAETNYMLPGQDGLKLPWLLHNGPGMEPPRGLVYCNPPYGRVIGTWIDKCRDEAGTGAEIVALVPARTDTRWFVRARKSAQAVAFWRGRLTFLGAPAAAPFPSALFYWGNRPWDFEVALRPYAEVWR